MSAPDREIHYGYQSRLPRPGNPGRFAAIKRMTAGGRFLTRGLKKVAGEATLSVLVYNVMRATNLTGAETLGARLA